MNNKLRVILLGGLLLGALVLSMSAVPAAFAAASTSSTSSSVTLPQLNPPPYAQGFEDGYKAAFQDGLDACKKFSNEYKPQITVTPSPYAQGYADGYTAGYPAGFGSCHHGDGGDD